ncbi:Hemagglutinin/hemolysin-related protein [Labilithrix luteola]|uniref:Hemagglutinin/hemolysin-related protein n=1 Tax=Labilithrix luteola TaxID=1391654 RepID=A0A0K1PLT8_9BACT|nr:Hemagglutinin/hemolysin-related protein [Labilithrix luteola]
MGCEFYPTVTVNSFRADVDSKFGVIVTNDSAEPVVVTTSKGDTILESRTLAGNTSAAFELPWVTELRGPASPSAMPGSVRVDQGSYRLRATRPVTVRQYSPIDGFGYSGDASLLLPVNAWGKDYRIVARHHTNTGEGFYAITASEDGTVVQLTAPPRGLTIKSGVTGIDAKGSGTITMNRGDVVEIVTASTTATTNDPTGTLAIADKPIQIIGGHQCAFVPDGVLTCDHLEETIWPISMAATRFIAVGPIVPSDPEPDQVIRILATQPGTTLTYEPPQEGAPTTIAQAGDWVELRTTKDVEVRANLPVLVAQYQVGSSGNPPNYRGADPSLTLAVPVDRYKTAYAVNTLPGMRTYVDMVAPLGSIVRLDGELIASLKPIGSSGFGVARHELAYSSSTPGIHHITGSAPVGVDVFGFFRDDSYWLPAELASK